MINAREYLRSFRIAEKRIRLNTQQVQHLWDQVLSISAPMDKEQVTHTKNTDVMGETVAAIIDIQKEIDRQTSELYKKQREAYILFEMISPESPGEDHRTKVDSISTLESLAVNPPGFPQKTLNFETIRLLRRKLTIRLAT